MLNPVTATVQVPYPMPPAIGEPTREKFMAWAVKQGYPRIKFRKMTDYMVQIACYGPSLEDSWRDINPERPLITVSGALKFLLDKGLKPRFGRWFHIEVDPRPHKIEVLARDERVVYVIGSCSSPQLFKYLEDMHVVLFHAMSGPHTREWVAANDPGQVLVAAGSTVGLTAIHVGGVFGFRHFEIHAMDGCYRGEARHAGPHGGMAHGRRPSLLDPAYTTSRMMDNANYEILAMVRNFPMFAVFHGDGLVQAQIEKANFYNAAKAGTAHADVVRRLSFEEFSPEQVVEMCRVMAPEAA